MLVVILLDCSNWMLSLHVVLIYVTKVFLSLEKCFEVRLSFISDTSNVLYKQSKLFYMLLISKCYLFLLCSLFIFLMLKSVKLYLMPRVSVT